VPFCLILAAPSRNFLAVTLRLLQTYNFLAAAFNLQALRKSVRKNWGKIVKIGFFEFFQGGDVDFWAKNGVW